MKYPGTITLYNENGRRLIFYRYSKGYKNILEEWRNFYGANFKKYYYHVSPDLNEAELIRELKKAS